MNRYLKYIIVMLLFLLIGTYSCELEKIDSCPCIRDIEPLTARAGVDITLTGDFENFDPSTDKITIGDSIVDSKIVGGRIIVEVPSDIASEKVPIMINTTRCPNVIEDCKNTFDYEKVTVTGISPNIGKKGETITINGSNFNIKNPSLNKVLFGNVPATTVVPVDENKLAVTVPTGAETGDVRVIVDGFEADAGEFTYKYSVIGEVKEISPSCCTKATEGFSPKGIAVDSDGNIYVADNLAHQIFLIDANTETMTSFAGSVDGDYGVISDENPLTLDASRFTQPFDLSLDDVNNIYISDTGNKQIIKIGLDEMASVYTKSINFPFGITVGIDNNVFFSDNSTTIKVIREGPVEIQEYAGFGDPSNSFDDPIGLVMDEDGNLWVADSGRNAIRYIEAISLNVINVADNSEFIYTEGPTFFSRPTDIHIDSRGNIFVVDSNNKLIRVISSTKKVYTLHGIGYSSPFSIAVHEETGQNKVYISDTENGVVKRLIYE